MSDVSAVTEPVVEPTTEPVVEPTTEPVVEPTTEPVVEPTEHENNNNNHRNNRHSREELEKLTDEELQKIVDENVPRYPKPNRNDLLKRQEKIDNEIADLKKKLNEYKKDIDKIIEERKNKKSGRQSTYTDLTVLSTKLAEANESKKKLYDDLNAKKKELEKLSKIDEAQKKNNRNGKPEQIQEIIEDLEDQIRSGELTMNEENEANKKINQLKLELNTAKNYKDVRPKMSKLREEIKDVGNKIGESKKVTDELKSRMDTLRATLKSSENQNTNDPIKEINEQREKTRALIDEKYKAKSKAFEDFKESQNKYFENIGNVYRQNDAKRILEDRQYQREEEKRRQEAEAEALKRPPFEEQMNKCKLLIGYCKGMLPAEATSTSATTEKPVIEGLITKKEEDSFFVGGATKSKKSKKNNKNNNKVIPLIHSLESLSIFDEIKVKAPSTINDLKTAIEQIEKRLELFTNLERGSNVEEALANQQL